MNDIVCMNYCVCARNKSEEPSLVATAGSFGEKREPGTKCLRMRWYYVITLSAATLATYSLRTSKCSE